MLAFHHYNVDSWRSDRYSLICESFDGDNSGGYCDMFKKDTAPSGACEEWSE